MADNPGRIQVAVRAVTALRVLRTQRPTLQTLAAELGTSERTARRYIEAIEAARIPVERTGEHYRVTGGW